MKVLLIALFVSLLCFVPAMYQWSRFIRADSQEKHKSKKRFIRYLVLGFTGVFLFLASIITLSHTNYFDYQKPMAYSRYDEITFDNFRGIELFQKSLYGSERFAYIVTTIEYEIEDVAMQ